jgi:hypothetical protein
MNINDKISQVYNYGPWRVPFIEVFIDWPVQVGNDKPLGKWLLYLEDNPIVEGAQGGECTVERQDDVNPLNLGRKPLETGRFAAPLMEDPALLRHANKSYTFAMPLRHKISPFDNDEKQTNQSASLNRVRRDRSMIIRADNLIDSDGKKTNIVTMVSFKFIFEFNED